MSLFPYTVIDPAIVKTGFNPLLASCMAVIPLTLVNSIAITVRQASLTEDFSLRAWFSIIPCGLPVASAQFPVQTYLPAPFWLYLRGTVPPAAMYTVPATAGAYYFNIQNLINQTVNFVYNEVDL
jgi:hypothetical protein